MQCIHVGVCNVSDPDVTRWLISATSCPGNSFASYKLPGTTTDSLDYQIFKISKICVQVYTLFYSL